MICPCKNCICLPICKHKEYYILFTDCSLLREYILNPLIVVNKHKEHTSQLYKILNPTHWTFENGEGIVCIFKIKRIKNEQY